MFFIQNFCCLFPFLWCNVSLNVDDHVDDGGDHGDGDGDGSDHDHDHDHDDDDHDGDDHES